MTNIRKQIRVLDEQTANRIAAGEVVERPASIVKELVENSLDAGSTAVTVDILEGGIERIRVTDNGSGLAASDVRLAFERHATSKISSGDALTDIGTLGFRGEALPSIAAVSRVTLTTKTRGDDTGVKIAVEGGAVKDISQAGCPQGTTVVVSDLFYNTPARKKFLRRPAFEGAAIGELLSGLALCRPEISIRFSQGGKTVFQTPGDGNMKSALYTIFGSSAAKEMLPVEGKSGYVSVSGYIAGGEQARGNRQSEIFFVNGRIVRDSVLSQGVETAMKERVMAGRFPICALRVSVPPELVDVNCHPAKTQVRFSDEGYVRQAVYDVVFAAVTEKDNVAAAISDQQSVLEEVKPTAGRVRQISDFTQRDMPDVPVLGMKPPAPPLILNDSAAFPQVVEKAEQLPIAESPAPETPIKMPEYRIIGQVFDTYLLIAMGEKLLVIDQHAAHERILYDKFSRRYGGETLSQSLLIARIFDVTQGDKAKIFDSIEILRDAGFEIDEFGANTIRISAVPVILGEPEISGFFSEFVDKLGEIGSLREPEKKRERIIQLACKKAVKAGDKLADAEIGAILSQLLESGSPPTCPHGRPVLIEITKRELEKRFGRIV